MAWFCAKCGELAPLKTGFIVVDPRFALVDHHLGTQQATSDPNQAAEIRKQIAKAKKERR